MHRLIVVAVLLFWAILFGGLAHLSMSALLDSQPVISSELQLLVSSTGSIQIMPVLLMIIVALFGWAILALIVSDHCVFREIEAHSYAAAIFMMSACTILAFAKFGAVTSLPAILTAALVTSVAASRHLIVTNAPLVKLDEGREIARSMALGAAHNSLLSRVSGRQLPGYTPASPRLSRHNVTTFPVKPTNGGNI